jgi:nitrite reductase/ring-hydroxylating ferredoxin subunit
MAERRVGREQDIVSASSPTLVVIDDTEIGIFAVGDSLYAYESRCPHQGGPVCRGQVLGRVRTSVRDGGAVEPEWFDDAELQLVCPWHGFEFEITTGRCRADPRFRLRSYPVRRRDGDVFVVL